MNKKIWDEILPDDETKERMFVNIQKKSRQSEKRIVFKPSRIVFAVIIVLLITTGFVYGKEIVNEIFNVINQFKFGDSTIIQIDKFDDSQMKVFDENGNELEGFSIGSTFSFPNRNEEAVRDKPGSVQGVVTFETYEAAREVVPFDFKELKYLNDLKLDNVYVLCFDGTKYGYEISISYYNDNKNHINLSQSYVGPEAYIEFATVASIQKVMLGDTEACLNIMNYNDVVESLSLIWVKNGIMFQLDCQTYVYDLETLIQIALSIE